MSFLIIVMIVKNMYQPKNITKRVSKNDLKEYFVRDMGDSQEAAEKLSSINNKLQKLIETMDKDDREGVLRLKTRYNPNALSETEQGSKYTSYSLNKGEKIALCIREKENPNVFIDENTIIFVAIHELAHIMTESVGHKKEFWDNMAFLLKEAEKINIYKPIDYSKNNVDYCGMEITTTPYEFKK